MNTRTVATLLFAGCCLFAIGSMAGSLDSTVPGDPDDVVDVDTESLPLPADDADELKEAVQSGGQGSGGGGAVDPSADGDSEYSPPVDDGGAAPDGGQSDQQSGAATQSSAMASAVVEPAESLLDTLLLLLVLLVALAVAVYKREWIRDRLREYFGSGTDEAGGPGSLSVRSPSNAVEERWLEMVSRVDPPAEASVTPRERAEAVVRAGLNRDAVDDLTGLYESVRYGDRTVTNDLAEEASAHLRRSTGESDD